MRTLILAVAVGAAVVLPAATAVADCVPLADPEVCYGGLLAPEGRYVCVEVDANELCIRKNV